MAPKKDKGAGRPRGGPPRIIFTRAFAPHVFLWLSAGAATLAVLSQAPDVYTEIIRRAIFVPLTGFLQYICLLPLVYAFYYLSGSVWAAVSAVSIAAFAFSLVNKFKVFLRGDPFMPTDIILGGEAFDIVSASSIKPGAGSVILFILIILGCAALGLFFRFRKPHMAERIAGAAAAVLLAVFCYFFVFTNDAVYASVPIKNNIYNMVNEYNSKGFILAFLYHTKDLNPGSLRPEGYSAGRAREILAEYETGADPGGEQGKEPGEDPGGANPRGGDNPRGGANPHGGDNPRDGVNPRGGDDPQGVGQGFKPDVIFLMSEAFWDITEIPSLIFDSADGSVTDPVPVFHELEKTCASGEFYANVYGGGTDTTEFGLLTGHNVANFNGEVSSAYKSLIRKNTGSIVRTFAVNGYETVALHPGFPWFYNRINVYEWLGFETFVDIGSFDEQTDISGNYISDAAMTDMLIKMYGEHTEAETAPPFFCFTVSIQNHGPYDGGWMYGPIPKNYLTAPDIALSIKSDYAVTNYVRGLSDADVSLGRLTHYLESVGRPVVLLFFGDHLPGLGSNFTAYKELGYTIGYSDGLEGKTNTFRNRYLIWANAAARAAWPGYEALKRESAAMSVNYLGVYLMDALGLELGPYEKLVEAARKILPVSHTMFYGADGREGAALTEKAPGDTVQADLLADHMIAQHYKIFDEKIE